MSDTKDTGDQTSSSRRGTRRPLSLRGGTVGSGTVRQNFSHGRSKAVVVEKKRKRVLSPKEAAAPKAEPDAAPQEEEKAPAAKAPGAKPSGKEAKAAPEAPAAPKREAKSKGTVLRSLTDEEQKKRAAALNSARARADEERKIAEARAKREAEEEAKRLERLKEKEREEKEEAERRAAELEARKVAEAEAARKLEEEEKAKAAKKKGKPDADAAEAEAKPAKSKGKSDAVDLEAELENELGGRLKRARPAETPKSPGKKSEPRRRSGKLTVVRALDDEGEERTRSLASVRRAREREKRRAQAGRFEAPQKITREVIIPETITVQELANRMATRAVDIIKSLMKQGVMLKINDVIDSDTAQLVAEEYGHTVKRVSESDVEEGLVGGDDADTDLEPRAPVVTVMGHVDHGKTSLLDALRKTDVVAGEAGGITQHIGAYQVQLPSDQKITFLDTPGHAAFTAMRARGAKVTDIVILVVAADDGVMPQTVEAINHAKAAEVPMIVAINKIDKEGADPSRVRNELLQHEIVVESLGGDTQEVEVSALKKTGLDTLEETVLLQAEFMELKANPNRSGEGIVVEAKLDKGRGPVATVLVQRGTLKVGDIFVAGAEWGRVRALMNDRGEQVEEAGPSVPVEILGLQGTPNAGEHFSVVENEARAREISDYRQRKLREKRMAGQSGQVSLEKMLAQLKDSEVKELPVVIKGDVQGSVEAITGALDQISTDEVRARPIHQAVGGITESDVILAAASNAPIIAFNVRANKQARDHAERDGVEIRYYSVIYDLIDDVKAAMSGLLSPVMKENFVGYAEILEVFNISKVGKVAGCRVTEGVVKRGNKVRLLRDDVVIHEGTLSTLKRFKDEVKEVKSGQECGMAFENYQDLQTGDLIECFEVEEVAREL